jgi:hypothetical protein
LCATCCDRRPRFMRSYLKRAALLLRTNGDTGCILTRISMRWRKMHSLSKNHILLYTFLTDLMNACTCVIQNLLHLLTKHCGQDSFWRWIGQGVVSVIPGCKLNLTTIKGNTNAHPSASWLEFVLSIPLRVVKGD